jgi:MbtH protein
MRSDLVDCTRAARVWPDLTRRDGRRHNTRPSLTARRAGRILSHRSTRREHSEATGADAMIDETDDTTTYTVVVNHEEQYSIWPAGREIPNGWREAGKTGSKSDCLEYIKEVWTDMRPLSLRKQMDG